jgi:phosphohistidine phosphatase
MRLVLARHGLAMSREDFAESHSQAADSDRPLLEKGREKSKEMAKILRKWQPDFDLIVFSPFLRTQQTAEIFAAVLKISNLFECKALEPDQPPTAFAEWLSVHADESTAVLAVGHEPQLSSFATWSLVGKCDPFIELKKSGLILLQVNSFSGLQAGSAMLEAVVHPRLMEF